MVRAMASALAPAITGTEISTGSLPSVAVTRNSRSPLDAALPVVAMFHIPAEGGAVAAKAEAATRAATTTRHLADFMSASGLARPGVFRGAVWRGGALFALDLDVHVAHVRVDELEREVGLTILLLDEDVLAVVDLDGVALGAELRGERVAHVPGDVVLRATAADRRDHVDRLALARRDPELQVAGGERLTVELDAPLVGRRRGVGGSQRREHERRRDGGGNRTELVHGVPVGGFVGASVMNVPAGQHPRIPAARVAGRARALQGTTDIVVSRLRKTRQSRDCLVKARTHVPSEPGSRPG